MIPNDFTQKTMAFNCLARTIAIHIHTYMYMVYLSRLQNGKNESPNTLYHNNLMDEVYNFRDKYLKE